MQITANFTDWVRFLCRITLGLLYLFVGLQNLSGNQGRAQAQTINYWTAPLDFQVACLSFLLCVAALWLVFGIRSRVIAVFACINLLGVNLAIEMTSSPTYPTAMFIIICLLSVPIIVGGGGKLAVYRAGWRNPL